MVNNTTTIKTTDAINMSTLSQNNRCRVCNKYFCCTNCRDIHENKKHSYQLKCPLCLLQKLQLNHFEDPELLCHIVINHLPLFCVLCGKTFKKNKDFESFGKCQWWSSERRRSIISDCDRKLSPLLTTPSPVNRFLSCPESFLKELSVDGEQDNFTSPPKLFRNTSTPMHVGYTEENFEFKTPKEPGYPLKTSKTSSISLTNQTNYSPQVNEDLYETASSSDTHFTTLSSSKSATTRDDFLKPVVSSHNASDKIHTFREFLKNTTKKKLNAMQEREENNCLVEAALIDMELTEMQSNGLLMDDQYLHTPPEALNNQQYQPKNGDSIKKVRFSDQYVINSDRSYSTCSSNVTESEEYHEAQENISEISVRSERTSLNSSRIRINRENEKNAIKENCTKLNLDTETTEPLNIDQQSVQPRVLMMVVLDNNGSLTSSDLTPLIDSGLRKLKRHVSAENVYSPTSNLSAQMNGNSSASTRRSITTIDSYVSISSTEFYSTPGGSCSSFGNSSASNKVIDGISSGGIFSTMAHAMRCALRSLSGSSITRNMSREPATRGNNYVLPLLAAQPDSSSNHSSSNVAPSVLQRPGKRSRDLIESSSSHQSDAIVSSIDSDSPVPKRHRGWQKIKGREPIARMRSNQVSLDRGVSSSTQCFKQGSLLIGDTALPIPSRAHRHTQTD